jgi:hypothetical protein
MRREMRRARRLVSARGRHTCASARCALLRYHIQPARGQAARCQLWLYLCSCALPASGAPHDCQVVASARTQPSRYDCARVGVHTEHKHK